jgi:hypothetical protein
MPIVAAIATTNPEVATLALQIPLEAGRFFAPIRWKSAGRQRIIAGSKV